MRTPPFERAKVLLGLLAVFASCCLLTAPAAAYQLPIRFDPPVNVPTPVKLSPPQIPFISGATTSRLAQFRKLVTDGAWDEAIEVIRDVASGEQDRVIALDERRYVSLQTYCQFQIARLPAEGLARYRQEIDGLAEAWYRDGLTRRDETQLRRIVDELFCSSWGDDALLALGELALERGDYQAARRSWEQISWRLREPRPRDPPTWLAYPDTGIDLAQVRARLALVSIRAGEFARAAEELAMLRRLHPQAIGMLGGQEGPFVPALERRLAAARESTVMGQGGDWPTFGGAVTRNAIAPSIGAITGPAWREPLRLNPVSLPAVQGMTIARGQPQLTVVREPQKPLCYFPVAAEGRLYYTDGTRINAVQLADGRPALTADGTIYRTERVLDGSTPESFSVYTLGPRYSLTFVAGALYARVGAPATDHVQVEDAAIDNWLVGLDVSRDGLLAFRLSTEDKEWAFDGAPVSDGHYLYVAMRRSDVNPHSAVACIDPVASRIIWRTPIGSGDTPAAGRSNEITHNLLTLVGDRLYFSTNLGLVAAIDTRDGAVCWLHRYDRRKEPIDLVAREVPAHLAREPSPVMYHAGLLFVAPSDTPNVFALDAETGIVVWSSDALADAVELLGVVDGTLVVSGTKLWGVDKRTGRVKYTWPEHGEGGGRVRGMGRGLIAGREVFWPTADEIQVLDVSTGRPTRAVIDSAALGGVGANLIVTDGYLIAAGNDRMMAYWSKGAGIRAEGAGVERRTESSELEKVRDE